VSYEETATWNPVDRISRREECDEQTTQRDESLRELAYEIASLVTRGGGEFDGDRTNEALELLQGFSGNCKFTSAGMKAIHRYATMGQHGPEVHDFFIHRVPGYQYDGFLPRLDARLADVSTYRLRRLSMGAVKPSTEDTVSTPKAPGGRVGSS